MANQRRDATQGVTIHDLTAVVVELSRDLVYAHRAAVRATLADAVEDIGADRAAAIATAILADTEARYRVAASATLIAIAPPTNGE